MSDYIKNIETLIKALEAGYGSPEVVGGPLEIVPMDEWPQITFSTEHIKLWKRKQKRTCICIAGRSRFCDAH